MVTARVEVAGLEPWRLGGEMWGTDSRPLRGGRLDGLCFAGPNLVPLQGNQAALRTFADRAVRRGRMCSSLVGPAEQVLGPVAGAGRRTGARPARCAPTSR